MASHVKGSTLHINTPTSHCPWTPATFCSLATPQGKHYINVNALRNCYSRSHSHRTRGEAHGVLPELFSPLCHSSGGSWKCSSDLGSDLLTQHWICASVICNWNSVRLTKCAHPISAWCAYTHTHLKEWLQKYSSTVYKREIQLEPRVVCTAQVSTTHSPIAFVAISTATFPICMPIFLSLIK